MRGRTASIDQIDPIEISERVHFSIGCDFGSKLRLFLQFGPHVFCSVGYFRTETYSNKTSGANLQQMFAVIPHKSDQETVAGSFRLLSGAL